MYFHDILKGCKLQEIKLANGRVENKMVINSILLFYQLLGFSVSKMKVHGLISALYCITHNKVSCSCGWEFGHHFDTDSDKIYKDH